MRQTNGSRTHLLGRRTFFVCLLWLAAAVGPPVTVGLAQDESGAAADTPRVDVTLSDGSTPPLSRLMWHVPDPIYDYETTMKRAAELRAEGNRSEAEVMERALQIAAPIRREKRLELSLEEALHRALATNYTIEEYRYNPAIKTAKVVQAESEFDAFFFLNATKNNIDRPSASALQATDIDQTTLATGISKNFESGASMVASWDLNRTRTTLQFQTINPEYTSGLTLDVRQPLLRKFGVDYNQYKIRLARLDRQASEEEFHETVGELLKETEKAYWVLVQARRNVVISARLLAEYEQILQYLEARRDFDVIPVQLAATKADLERERTKFVALVTALRDAEGGLAGLMNSEDINLIEPLEIVPTDFPVLTKIEVDPVAELQTALDSRPDLRGQRIAIAAKKIEIGKAKNDELPQLDLRFQARSSGLAISADRAFDESTSYNFIEYLIQIEFGFPIGNRLFLAESKVKRLEYAQQAAKLRGLCDTAILEVNAKVRALRTTFLQIASSYESAEARLREVDSIVARAERKDINTLKSELSARSALAAARSDMLEAIVKYNIAIIELERSKGTLLRYNNVELPFKED